MPPPSCRVREGGGRSGGLGVHRGGQPGQHAQQQRIPADSQRGEAIDRPQPIEGRLEGGHQAVDLLAALLLLSCATPNGVVLVNFRQVGACNGWVQGNVAHSVGPNAAYVVFQLTGVDASQGTVDFALDPAKLYVNVDGHQHSDAPITGFLTSFLGVSAVAPVTIPKGQVVSMAGYDVVVVPTVQSNGAVEANQTSYFLLHDTGAADPGVVLVKADPKRTSWPLTEDCGAIAH